MRPRWILPLLVLWMLAPAAWAQDANPSNRAPAQPAAGDAPTNPAYVKLETQLNDSQGIKRAEVLAKLSAMDFDAAHNRYLAGDAASGAHLLELCRSHAAEAFALVQQQAKTGKTKGMEKVEYPLQSVSYGLQRLTTDVSLADRPVVQGAANYFSTLRAQILELMFAPKPNPQ